MDCPMCGWKVRERSEYVIDDEYIKYQCFCEDCDITIDVKMNREIYIAHCKKYNVEPFIPN